tara:strand:- start:1206 stop:2210 length:1005 start_codon:yes stop_codon:yes gene_type:complete
MEMNKNFLNSKLLITGGTGSFGNAVLNNFLCEGLDEIRIFSRDEKKQDEMRKKYNNNKIKFYLGDVRDINSVKKAINGCDFVFHAAALKQVPSCEFYPLEAIKTNILGTENVLEASINCKVKKVVCLSTDKAVYPINVMGMSKALMEKTAIAKSLYSDQTIITITRYGNVMGSRGSVIPLFVNQIKQGIPISITNKNMTRFMMNLDEAVKLVLFAFNNGNSGEIFIQKSPASTIEVLAKSIFEILGKENYPIDIIGTRHGEKLYEVLLSREEMVFAQETENYFCIKPDLRDLNYSKYFENGKNNYSDFQEYNSQNTIRLNQFEMVNLLKKSNLF